MSEANEDKLRESEFSPEDFDYNLPPELIAQEALSDRSASRMMVVDRKTGVISHKKFRDLGSYLKPDDLIVMNDSKVFPARLQGVKKLTGGKCEVLLLARHEQYQSVWTSLCQPKIKPGQIIQFESGLEANCIGKNNEGYYLLEFNCDDVLSAASEIGRMPLPNYIKRTADHKDRDRYQTVYAKNLGSVAAPTAGLHFTPEIIAELLSRGVKIQYLTLHVGYGTFQPVYDVERHQMHTESFSISPELAEVVNQTLDSKKKILAVGSTSTRTLETCAVQGRLQSGTSETDLFILPPFRFEIVGSMLTNFHVPKSSLMMLVSAFAGRELILEAYKKAVEERYRFHSYGDAMLIL